MEVYDDAMIITTPRTRLRCWEQTDQGAFAAMHADPAVMHDYGGPISRGESDAKLDRYAMTYRQHGFCRWAVESGEGAFLGYAGVMRHAQAIRSVHISRLAGDWCGARGGMDMPPKPRVRH
jgi:RimJ/RimL family protein N-acetyltransferase